MAEGQQERDTAAQRVPHHVGPFEFQMLDQCRDVVGHQLRAERPIDVGRPSVPLQIDRDDLAASSERRQVWPEHRDRTQTAVK